MTKFRVYYLEILKKYLNTQSTKRYFKYFAQLCYILTNFGTNFSISFTPNNFISLICSL